VRGLAEDHVCLSGRHAADHRPNPHSQPNRSKLEVLEVSSAGRPVVAANPNGPGDQVASRATKEWEYPHDGQQSKHGDNQVSNPPELPEHARLFISKLSEDDIGRLAWLLGIVETIEGWCKINRMIAKFIIVFIIGTLILFSQAFDAVRNLLSWKH
jgi:hypothetical protein